jgi:hypothetical protein
VTAPCWPYCCSSPIATKYLRCRNSILILYRDWSDSKDVLDVLDTLCQIRLTKVKNGKKKPKAKPIREKRPTLKQPKRQAMVLVPAALER